MAERDCSDRAWMSTAFQALRAPRQGRGLRRARRRARRQPRRVPDAPRAVGLRQDDDAADDRGLRDAGRGTHPLRRRRTSRASPPTGATSASCSRTMRCFRICRSSRTSPTACACAAIADDEIAHARRRSAGAGRARGLRAAVLRPALRRRAAAGRAGARDRHPAARAAVRRAAVEPRRQAARADAPRDPRPAAALAITTVYVTHDQEEAMAVSDRIAVMNEGSVVQEGHGRGSLPSPGIAVRRAIRRPREPGRRPRGGDGGRRR